MIFGSNYHAIVISYSAGRLDIVSMKYSEHVESFIGFITTLGRQDKERVIRESCLVDRDCEMLVLRYVHGLSIQESADKMGMEYDAFVKAQRKAIERFYSNSFPIQFHSA